jgi:multiple sugar transport system permease protein
MNKSNRKVWLALIVSALVLIELLPILWVLVSSFKAQDQIYSIPPTVIFAPHFSNYRDYFAAVGSVAPIVNSLIAAIEVVVISVVLGIPLGYELARKPNKNVSFWLLSLIMMPPVVTAVPLFNIFHFIGLLNSLQSVVISYTLFSVPFMAWLLRAYVAEVPISLDEASAIDGASRLQILIRIIVPATGGGIAAASFLIFMFTWNGYLLPSILTDYSSQTLQVAIGGLVSNTHVAWTFLLPASIVSMIPLLVFAFLVQRHLVSGFSLGAVKG